MLVNAPSGHWFFASFTAILSSMNGPNKTATGAAGLPLARGEIPEPRRPWAKPYSLILSGIVLLAAIPRLYLGATQFIEYDGYWQAFIGEQKPWQNFLWDYQQNAHPPLYNLVLRVSLWFGHSPLIYRAVSILAGLAAIFVVERIASKMMCWAPSALLAALVYGVALPAIIVSDEVRQYMLCVCLVLISYFFFLDFGGREDTSGSDRPRLLFAVTALLACLSHYCAVFYVAALWVVSAGFLLIGAGRARWKTLLRDAATFGPVILLTSFEYLMHYGLTVVDWRHLPEFYYVKGGPETLRQFLLRNLQNTFNLFSPWPIQNRAACLAVIALLLVAGAVMLYVLRRIGEPKNLAAAITILALLLMLAEVMVGGAVRAYPFGGQMRQQFFLFPFFVLCVLLMVDRLTMAVPRGAAVCVAAALALTTLGVSAEKFSAYPKDSTALYTDQMQQYNRLFPNPEAIYIDQFNLILFFIHHDNWKWQFLRSVPSATLIDLYNVSRDGQRMLLFRDKGRWALDFNDPDLYRDVAALLRGEGLSSMTFFEMAQELGPPRSAGEIVNFRNRIADFSAAQGMCVQTLVVRGYEIYAEMRTGGCSAESPSQETAPAGNEVDDVSPRITYGGRWQSGIYKGARNDTLTYSNQPGASAALTFRGTGIQYVYTKAFNRGQARVTIDGREQAVIDLYDPKILWRTTSTFSGLAPGSHMIEITVLGSHDPASQDSYIDIDALIPQ